MGKVQVQPVYPKGFDFEQIWAALMNLIVKENAERQKETDRILKEIARRQADRQKEFDRILKENSRRQNDRQKETDRILKENAERQTDRQLEADRILKENIEQQKEIERLLKEAMKDNARLLNATAWRQTGRQLKDFPNRFGEIAEYTLAPSLREKFKDFGLNFPKANSNTNISDHDKDTFLEIGVMLESNDKAMLIDVKAKLTVEDIKEHIKRLKKMRAYADLHGDKRVFLGAVAGTATGSVKERALGQGFYVIEPSGETFFITPPNGQPKKW